MSTPIFVTTRTKGRVSVGTVTGNVFYKKVKRGNFVLTLPGIAFDVTTLDDAERAGGDRVCITEVTSDGVFVRKHFAFIKTIRQFGELKNWGHGMQKALHLNYWAADMEGAKRILDNPPPSPLRGPQRPPPPAPDPQQSLL